MVGAGPRLDGPLPRSERIDAQADISELREADTSGLDDRIDPWLRGLQILAVLALAGSLAAFWNTLVVWTTRGSSWWARISAPLVFLATAAVVWFIVVGRVLNPNLNF